jgi:RNA polymerase sigma factor (sigma-70 family)
MNYHAQSSCHIVSNEEIHWYLQDLAKMPVLSLKEEQDVVRRIAADPHSREADEARKLLIEAHLRLVVRLARRYLPFGLELADLIQEGSLALTKAAQQFDPQRSQHFRPFATQRVIWTLHRMAEEHLRERHSLDAEETEPIRPLSAQALKALLHDGLDEQAMVFDLPQERFISLDALLDELDSYNLRPDDRSYDSDYLIG